MKPDFTDDLVQQTLERRVGQLVWLGYLVIGGIAGGAVWATNVTNTLSELQKDFSGFMKQMEVALDRQPPQWMRDAVRRNERELERQQVQIDRIEAAISGRAYDGKGYTGRPSSEH